MKKWLRLMLTAVLISSCAMPVNTGFAKEKYDPYISGFEDNTFRPDSLMTKAEAVSLFAGLLDNDDKALTDFSDTPDSAWYYGSLCRLNANGFLRYTSGSFEPNSAITRLGLCEYVYVLENGRSSLSAEEMFEQLIKEDIIKGYDDGSYGADRTVTRAEAVALINRALGMSADAASTAGLNYNTFSDVKGSHWAFYDIIFAAKNSRKMAAYPTEIPSDHAVKQFDKYNELKREWEIVPMINDELRAKGVKIGGEGAQRMNSIAISADGSFLLCGNDTATIHRSINGGKTWEMCNRGFVPLGGQAFAIDPNNADRCIGYGASNAGARNGIYLSVDRGFSWRQVLSQKKGYGQLELRESLCYDASSYSEEIGGSAIAYWSKNYMLLPPQTVYQSEESVPAYDEETEKKGLWKTTDGGETWFVVNEDMTDSIIKVNPETGVVYAANLKGFFRSEDGGQTFDRILSGSMIYGMDVIATHPEDVYINDYKGVLVSHDSGKTFKRIKTQSFPKSADIKNPFKAVVNLKVSPKNPNNMVVAYYEGFGAYKCSKYFSADGGVTWSVSTQSGEKDFFMSNNREAMFVWSPTDENKVWSFGGDWIVSSVNGGKSYVWDYEGGSAVFVDGRSMFNLYNPDLFYYGSQDFHGAFTEDKGRNWKHIWKVNGNQYSGFVYGAYAADENTLIALCSTGKSIEGVGTGGGWGGVSEIRVSRDKGEKWENTGVYILDNHRKKWSEMCYQSPNDPQILFAANYRSTDFGATWEKMPVDAVYTHNPYGRKELYAGCDQYIMVSYDDGATWEEYCEVKIPESLAETPEKTEIWDMSYDGINGIMYYVSGVGHTGTYICKYKDGATYDLTDNRPKTGIADTFQLCAVDPRYPNVLYIGGYGGSMNNGGGVLRSVDGGESFQILSNLAYEESIVKTGPCGGIGVYDLIVHPVTGELYAPQNCAGWVKIGPPYENAGGLD